MTVKRSAGTLHQVGVRFALADGLRNVPNRISDNPAPQTVPTWLQRRTVCPVLVSRVDTSPPSAMDRTHMLHPINFFDLPLDVIWNFNDLQLRPVTVCLLAEFLHHAYELLVVAGNQDAILV